MNWYKNLKIKFKFLISFGVIVLLVTILGVVGITTANQINKRYSNAINSNEEIVNNGIGIIYNVTNLRSSAFNNLLKINAETSSDIKAEMKEIYDNSHKSMENYLTLIENSNIDNSRQEEIDSINSIIHDLEAYFNGFMEFIDATVANDIARANELDNQLTEIGDRFFNSIYTLPQEAFDYLSKDVEISKSISNKKSLHLGIIFILIQIFVILSGIKLVASITGPLQKLKKVTLDVAKGKLNSDCRTNNRDEFGELSNAVADMSETLECIINDINVLSTNLDNGNIYDKIDTEKYYGSFKEVTSAINLATNNLVQDSLYVIDRIKDFSNGEFNSKIKDFPGEKKVIKEGLISVQDALKHISIDIKSLIDSANNGDLEFRLDTSMYIGQWQEIISGLNSFVENVVVPIKETQNALNQFSIGNFDHRITNEYKGEFDNIKQTVNYTAETIGSYINEISQVLDEMANKNFVVSIDREYLGDFKQIQESVNLIIQNLNLLTRDIISSAEQVSSGAKQISESSISLAEGATEQASSVEELNKTIEIISNQSMENVKNSETASELALQAKNSANDGSKQMDTMLSAMEEINNASNSISNIIKVIDDIAFQTNILALNAAVEAARAGEHGKGFAVVAEEVRGLAARSQQAAKETTELISSSVEKVTEGSKIANNTAESLLNIVKQIEEIANLTSSCAISSKEQELSIEQITDAISQISTVTQNNTATSEESAAASQELASQAEVFFSSVSDFKLKSDI